MKHILKVVEQFDFDHTKNKLSDCIVGFDFERSYQLMKRAIELKTTSEKIEFLMFGNTELLKNRIMAIYGLGLFAGADSIKGIKIEIKEI